MSRREARQPTPSLRGQRGVGSWLCHQTTVWLGRESHPPPLSLRFLKVKCGCDNRYPRAPQQLILNRPPGTREQPSACAELANDGWPGGTQGAHGGPRGLTGLTELLPTPGPISRLCSGVRESELPHHRKGLWRPSLERHENNYVC